MHVCPSHCISSGRHSPGSRRAADCSSHAGDSQLVRVHATPPDPGQPDVLVEVLDTFDSLGPIVDFVVVDLDRQGQGQVLF